MPPPLSLPDKKVGCMFSSRSQLYLTLFSHSSYLGAALLPKVFIRLGKKFGGVQIVEKCVRDSQVDPPSSKKNYFCQVYDLGSKL